MELSYRGVVYEQDIPAVDMIDGEMGGKYRGQPWTYRYPRHIPVPQPTPVLKYRGVNYCTDPRTTAEACYTAPAAERTPDRPARVVSNSATKRQKFLEQVEETHYRNICRRLEHRLQVARMRGDRDLLRMLEAEMQFVGQYC